jgi:hypothetical protein
MMEDPDTVATERFTLTSLSLARDRVVATSLMMDYGRLRWLMNCTRGTAHEISTLVVGKSSCCANSIA